MNLGISQEIHDRRFDILLSLPDSKDVPVSYVGGTDASYHSADLAYMVRIKVVARKRFHCGFSSGHWRYRCLVPARDLETYRHFTPPRAVVSIERWGRYRVYQAKIGTLPASPTIINRVRSFRIGQVVAYSPYSEYNALPVGDTPVWHTGAILKIEGDCLFLSRLSKE